jgi:hypothetical protein
METLGKLFNSQTRVKVMRLFLLNSETCYDTKDVAQRSKSTPPAARRELAVLAAADFIKKKTFIKEIHLSSGKHKKKKVSGWQLNATLPYLEALRNLLVDSNTMDRNEIMRRFKGVGKIKLFVIAGIFTKDNDSRLDVMIVGDNLKRNLIERSLHTLESELGRELSYALFDTPEFVYRLNMYDKLIADVLDFPHETLVNSLNVIAQSPKKPEVGYPHHSPVELV